MSKKKDFNPSYVGSRPDVRAMLPNKFETVLDVGCSVGNLGAAIKRNREVEVVGVEVSESMAEKAKENIDEVFVGDATEILSGKVLAGRSFDVIVFADVLEHLVDPWLTLEKAVRFLEPGGVVLASLPNVRHYETLVNIIWRADWPYRERGIFDKTHLRYFTRKGITDLFEGGGLSIEKVERNYRLIERPHGWNSYAKYLALPGFKEFLVFQYLICARFPQ